VRWFVAGVALLSIAGCATTVDEQMLADQDLTTISGGVIVDSTSPTTAPIEGSTAQLLAEMAAEMSRLSSLIVDRGDAEASLARIVAIWATIEPEVKDTRPGLVNSIGATVALAETAVERTRPADADKAFSLLTDIVDAYTGDA
jgi:hypothetical protein